ncbi:hypothetical protein [Actinoallomurus rhizosphaericola]|uniref:hypothetical protein n=1 Tax=Actinoallomurus rhizosphaericola TaxID=2952536 RepID=UPI0020905182|nr:hypothetical protein [Actinoallomurus rhizosphaericola]MCO5993621.1 hypothetical protein [Actinoallomurus rhizosphaericola]
MKKLFAATAVSVAVAAVPAVAYARDGGKLPTCTATFVDHPENAPSAWALDDFTRTTTFAPGDTDGTWKVHIHDEGHFTTIPGTTSDSGDPIQLKVTGSLDGDGDYTVTSTAGPKCVDAEQYKGTDGPKTAQWPLHYFTADADAKTSDIDPWRWVYQTYCEKMVEDSRYAKVDGHLTGKDCPTPTPTPTPTDTTPEPDPSSADPEPSASETTPTDETTASPATEAPAASPVKKQPHFTG